MSHKGLAMSHKGVGYEPQGFGYEPRDRKMQEFFIEQQELHDIARPVLEFLKEQPGDRGDV